MTLVSRHSGLTDIGLQRKTNEDTFVVAPPLFAVCDGMGGAQAGEIASGLAAQTLVAEIEAGRSLLAAAQAANAAVFERARGNSDLTGMGTTLTAMRLEAAVAHFVHIGDSRAYLLRDGVLVQVSEDHSLVGELVRSGRLTAEEAAVHPHRSILSRALGTEPAVKIDEFSVDLVGGDVVLLCSDGLSGPVSAAAIAGALAVADVDMAAERLIAEARRQGGPDNITALVVRVDDEDAAAPDRASASAVEAVDEEKTEEIASPDDGGAPEDPLPRRGRRRFGFLVALLAVATLVGLAGAVILSTVFFITVSDDRLVVNSGLPYEVGPLPLHARYRSSSRLYSTLALEQRVLVDEQSLHGEQGVMDLGRDLGMWP